MSHTRIFQIWAKPPRCGSAQSTFSQQCSPPLATSRETGKPSSLFNFNLQRERERERERVREREMAGRLSKAASTILGGNGVVCRSVGSSLRQRAGMGLPVGKHIVPDKPVSLSLIWFPSYTISFSWKFFLYFLVRCSFPWMMSLYGTTVRHFQSLASIELLTLLERFVDLLTLFFGVLEFLISNVWVVQILFSILWFLVVLNCSMRHWLGCAEDWGSSPR